MHPAIQVTRTVKVIVRHSSDCKDKNKGAEWRKCRCGKSLFIYENGHDRRESAKTRSWEQAEKQAQDLRDSWDPEKAELKRLRAKEEATQVRLEEAVALYCADMIARLGDKGTVAMARSLLGHIDPQTKAVKSDGKLFEWLKTFPINSRPIHVADITPTHLTQWRSVWNFGSDQTAAQRWGMVKGFFGFCESQNWISDNPARKLKRMEVKKGNRTAIFTDEQYARVLDSVYGYEPENIPEQTRKSWQQRLTTFIELLRWSGMDLTDAVQFRPELVDKNGVLRYRRQKTDILAIVQLPERLIVLLRDIPLEQDSVGHKQPFRTNAKINSDTATWSRRLKEVFKIAGINQVRTEIGKIREPHAKMFRDTFAVSNLRRGASIYAVARMMGHSKSATTEKAYLPFVQELEKSVLDESRKVLEAFEAEAPKKGRVVPIGGGRHAE